MIYSYSNFFGGTFLLGDTVMLSEANDECDEDIDQNQQIFDFVDVPSLMPLFTGNRAEPLYFVKVTEKGTAIKDMMDPYGHFIHTGEFFFKGNYLKLTRSRSLNNKKFQILPNCKLFPSDDVYDTYVEIDNDLQLNINIYNALVAKAHI